MSKICHLVLLAILLSASTARAQPGPIIVTEHDWTFRMGSARYGIYQARWQGGGGFTSVYFSKSAFNAEMMNRYIR